MGAHRKQTTAAMMLAWLYIAGGSTALIDAHLVRRGDALDAVVRAQVTALSIGDLVIAGVIMTLPWRRWIQRATLVPFALAVVMHFAFAATGFMSAPVSVAFLMLGIVWLGAFHPYRWVVVFSGPAALAYAGPLLVQDAADEELSALFVIVPVLLLVGLAISHTVELQRQAQRRAERRTRLIQVVAEAGRRCSLLDPADIVAEVLEVVHELGFPGAAVVSGDEQKVTVATSDRGGVSYRVFVPADRLGGLPVGDQAEIAEPAVAHALLPELAAYSRVIVAPVRGPERAVALLAADTATGELDGGAVEAIEILANQAGQGLHLADSFQAVQRERRRTERDALRDGLTGVGNRRALDLALDALQPGDGVVLLDLDHFKAVNDRYGHLRGDEVLRELGAYLRGFARPCDDVSRLGGEEFVVVLGGAGDRTPGAVTRLLDGWRQQEPVATLSAGFATHNGGRTAAETLEAADRALYLAKHAGRDRAVAAPDQGGSSQRCPSSVDGGTGGTGQDANAAEGL